MSSEEERDEVPRIVDSPLDDNFEGSDNEPARPPPYQSVARIADLPPFRGLPQENFEVWIKSFLRLGQANEWNNEKLRRVLPLALRDYAAEVYDDLSQDERKTFQDLVKNLQLKLQPSKVDEIALNALMSRKQGYKEPVSIFACEILRLVRQGCPGIDDANRRKLTLSFFVQNLLPEIRDRMALSYATFDDAVAAAKGIEARIHVDRGNAPWLQAAIQPGAHPSYHPNNPPHNPEATNYNYNFTRTSNVEPSTRFPKAQNNDNSFMQELRDLANKLDANTLADQVAKKIADRQNTTTNPRYEFPNSQSYRDYKPTQNTYNRHRNTPQNTQNPVQQIAPRFQWTADGQPVCGRCGQVGHIKRVCRGGREPPQRSYHQATHNSYHANRQANLMSAAEPGEPSAFQHQLEVLMSELELLKLRSQPNLCASISATTCFPGEREVVGVRQATGAEGIGNLPGYPGLTPEAPLETWYKVKEGTNSALGQDTPSLVGKGARTSPGTPTMVGEGARTSPVTPTAVGEGARTSPVTPITVGEGARTSPETGSGLTRDDSRTSRNPPGLLKRLIFLTSCFLFTISASANHTSSAFRPNEVFDQKISRIGTFVSESFGVAISPVGLVLTASKVEHLPVVIQLTGAEMSPSQTRTGTRRCHNNRCYDHNKTCTETPWLAEAKRELEIELSQAYAGVLDVHYYARLMKTLCDHNTRFCDTSTREKRFLGVLAAGILGITGTGLGIANSFHLAHLETKAQALNKAVHHMQGSISKLQKSVLKLSLANEHVYAFLHHSMQNIVHMIEDVQCMEHEDTYYLHGQLMKHTFAEKVQRTVDGLMFSALHGHLSPAVINIPMLTKLFEHSPTLSKSLLMKEPSLIYQFGKVYPVNIDFSRLRFAFILEIPVPAEDDVKPLFQIANVGWNNIPSNLKLKLSLPTHAVRDVGTGFQEVDIGRCKNKPGISYCDAHAFSQNQYADCLRVLVAGYDLVANLTRERCKKSVKVAQLMAETELAYTLAGVIFRTTEPHYTMTVANTGKPLTRGLRYDTPANGVRWLPHSSYTHLIVGDRVATSMLEQVQLSVVVTTESQPFHLPSLKLRPIDWTDLEAAETQNLQTKHMMEENLIRIVPLAGYGFPFFTILYVLVVLAAAVGLFFLIRACNKRYRLTQRRQGSQATEQLMGSNTDEDEVPLAELQRRRQRNRHLYTIALAPILVTILVDDCQALAMIDSGADISIVSGSLLSKIGTSYTKKSGLPHTQSASGHAIPLIGDVSLKVQIGPKFQSWHKFLVASWAPNSCILGVDFMNAFFKRVTFNFETGHCEFLDILKQQQHVIPMNMTQEQSKQPTFVSALDTITIPPRSQTMLNALVEDTRKPVRNALFEPSANTEKGLILGHALVQTGLGVITIPVINTANYPIKIHEGTRVGTVSPTHSNQILYLQDTTKQLLCLNSKISTQPNTTTPKPTSKEIPLDLGLEETNLNESEKNRLLRFVADNHDIFSKHELDIGRCTVIRHTIDTGTAEPIKLQPHRLPHHLREQLRTEIKSLLDKGIISPSNSAWGAPIVYTKKKEGSWRLCADFRKLNGVAKPDIFPLPRIGDILDSLAGAKYITSLDLSKGFWQLELDKETKHKTSFVTFYGQFEYNVLPFGLNSSPGFFQRAMSIILAGLEWHKCLIYLDDILIFSKTFDDHLADLGEVFQRFRSANLKLNLRKCQFCRKCLHYLGHIISSDGVQADPTKVEAVKAFATPKNVKQLESFLGLAGYYQRFIDNYSKIALPLNRLRRKNVPFNWPPACQKAFEELKERLTTAPLLIYPDFEKPFLLYTDASGFALGAVLSQMTPDGIKPVAFASRALLDRETRYSTTEKEALGMKWAITHYRHYLYGSKFQVFTDHQPLKWLMTTPPGNSRLAKWKLELQEYAGMFTVEYRAGNQNKNADALSRDPRLEATTTQAQVCVIQHTTTEDEITPLEGEAWNRLGELQRMDAYSKALCEYLEEDKLPDDDALARKTLLSCEKYYVEEGILYWIADRRSEKVQLVVVPDELRGAVLTAAHDSIYAGHFGAARTHFRASQHYFWPRMRQTVKQWCDTCQVCVTRKNPPRNAKAPLHPIPTFGFPMIRMHVDILDLHKTTSAGNRYFIGFIDSFSKYVVGFSTPNMTADTCASLFMEKVVCILGSPVQLVSDRGGQFVSALNRAVCELAETNKTETTSFHPACNGQIERFHRTLLDTLSSVVSSNHEDWDLFLPYCLLAYNTSIHATTHETPHYLMHGWDPRLPAGLPEPTVQDGIPINDYSAQVMLRLNTAWEAAQRAIEKAQKQQADYYNEKASDPSYMLADLVYVKIPRTPKGQCRKLAHFWAGPYRIVGLKPPNAEVRMLNKKHTQVHKVHFNLLKPCKGPRIIPLTTRDPLEDVFEEPGDPNLEAEAPE